MSKPKKFSKLNPNSHGGLFSPIESKRPLDKNEGAEIQFLLENKSDLIW